MLTEETVAVSGKERAARIVTEAAAPAVLVGAVLLAQPLLDPSVRWFEAAIAAAFTVGFPFTAILWRKKNGSVTDHHVGERTQRAPVFIFAGASMGAGTLLLLLLNAPAALFMQIGLIFLGLVLCLVSNLMWKLSVHAAVATYVGLAYAAQIPTLGIAAALALPAVVGWSRIVLGDHTATQVLAGQGVGVVVYAVSLLVLS